MKEFGKEFFEKCKEYGLEINQAARLFSLAREEFFGDEQIASLRNNYFAYRDRLHAEGSTGYSKVELHELAKKYILPKLIEEPENFNDGGKDQKDFSVTWLSKKGWRSFIEEFKLFAAENFNTYL